MAVSDRLAGFVFPGYNPIEVPNPPTLNSVPAGTTAAVTFTAPTDIGGAPISSYIVVATNTTTGAAFSASGSSSPVTLSGLPEATYKVSVHAVNLYGPSGNSNTITQQMLNQGQTAYTTSGTYTWVAPAGASTVSIVCVGGGGATGNYFVNPNNYFTGGGGGALAYVNNYAVTTGNSYTVIVADGGPALGTGPSTDSSFNGTTCKAGSGSTNNSNTNGGAAGTVLNGTGGNGGTGGNALASTPQMRAGSGGGAGGYSGNGGNGEPAGVTATGSAGSGGGGGSGGVYSSGGAGGGGGVGILGQGANGAAGAAGAGGGGGSGGNNGSNAGGIYGGGGGYWSGGGVGAVRIIWPGATRQFPSTNTGDV